MRNPTVTASFGPVISAYTRQQAIADGVLVDVTTTASEAGFAIPVAVTVRRFIGPVPTLSRWSVCEAHDPTGEPGAGNRHAGFGERGLET